MPDRPEEWAHEKREQRGECAGESAWQPEEWSDAKENHPWAQHAVSPRGPRDTIPERRRAPQKMKTTAGKRKQGRARAVKVWRSDCSVITLSHSQYAQGVAEAAGQGMGVLLNPLSAHYAESGYKSMTQAGPLGDDLGLCWASSRASPGSQFVRGRAESP